MQNIIYLMCSVCKGLPTDKAGSAINNTIIFMCILLVPVLGTFLYAIHRLAKREKKFSKSFKNIS